LAKTSAAALFGVANGLVPVILAAFLTPMAGIAWGQFIAAVALIAVSSTFLGLLVAASVSEVFEAQTLSNFFRFPMIFLCGLFFPIERLPEWLRPVSYILPLTYGADALHAAVTEQSTMPCWLDLAVLAAFCVLLFLLSLRTIQRRWIA
jgi:ABC-2 type transport system permease protein